MLKDNWLAGIGPGNKTFLQTYGLYMISGFDALGSYNIFLEYWIEFGIFGLLCFLFILLTSFLKLHYIFWLKNSFLAYGVFLSLIAAVSHGIFDTVFFRAQVYIPFWLLIASIGKLESRDECRGL
jgi:putative inorganic carbon (HCO3(-)) transporter